MTIAIDFAEQVVLVTGGATGLGRAIAAAFGQAGATVALNDRTAERAEQTARELDAAGIASRGYGADVRDGAEVRQMIDRVVAELGRLDIVVANAGCYPNTPFLDLSEDEWDQVLDTNLKGVFLTCQAAARAMTTRGGGQLLVIASGAANNAIWGWSHYCASKAAVVMLARAMALELGEHGIRVNALLPGYIDVPDGGDHLDERYKRAARAANLRGRPGMPEDVARAALLLASPLAGYVTGTTLVVDGGGSAGRLGVRPASPAAGV